MNVFQQLCKSVGLPVPVPEHRFHPSRKWAIDYAFVNEKIAVEVEGGVWTSGRHTRGSGYVKDLDKYNQLTVHGWRLIRVMPKTLNTTSTLELIKQAIKQSKDGAILQTPTPGV